MLAIQYAAIERRIVLAWYGVNRAGLETARDFPEQANARGVRVAIVDVVREIAGKQHEIRLMRRAVEQRHRALEGSRSQRIGRTLEANVRVAELGEGEARRGLAVKPLQIAAHFVRRGAPHKHRRELVQRADSERSSRNPEKRSPVHWFFHLCYSLLAEALAAARATACSCATRRRA